jgi:exonuclease III
MHVPQAWADPLVQPKQCKRDMRYGTWNVRSLYGSSSLKTAPKELARYKLDVVGVQEVKFFSMEKETKIIYSEQEFLYTME